MDLRNLIVSDTVARHGAMNRAAAALNTVQSNVTARIRSLEDELFSSAAARGPGLISVYYNASKAGLEGLTRGYAARRAKDGITVNAVAPGPVDTEMAEQLTRSDLAARVPTGWLGTAEEVADVVLMLAGNALITGQTILVNGGVTFI